jgi:hypothetical protein
VDFAHDGHYGPPVQKKALRSDGDGVAARICARPLRSGDFAPGTSRYGRAREGEQRRGEQGDRAKPANKYKVFNIIHSGWQYIKKQIRQPDTERICVIYRPAF